MAIYFGITIQQVFKEVFHPSMKSQVCVANWMTVKGMLWYPLMYCQSLNFRLAISVKYTQKYQ